MGPDNLNLGCGDGHAGGRAVSRTHVMWSVWDLGCGSSRGGGKVITYPPYQGHGQWSPHIIVLFFTSSNAPVRCRLKKEACKLVLFMAEIYSNLPEPDNC